MGTVLWCGGGSVRATPGTWAIQVAWARQGNLGCLGCLGCLGAMVTGPTRPTWATPESPHQAEQTQGLAAEELPSGGDGSRGVRLSWAGTAVDDPSPPVTHYVVRVHVAATGERLRDENVVASGGPPLSVDLKRLPAAEEPSQFGGRALFDCHLGGGACDPLCAATPHLARRTCVVPAGAVRRNDQDRCWTGLGRDEDFVREHVAPVIRSDTLVRSDGVPIALPFGRAGARARDGLLRRHGL